MLQTLIKKLVLCFVGIMIIVTCASCKAGTPYYIKEYLKDLADKTGIGVSENYLDDLNNWNVIEEDDLLLLDKRMNYAFLNKTISKLIDSDNLHVEQKDTKYINREDSLSIIDKAVKQLNNRLYPIHYEYIYKEEVNDDNEIGSIVLIDDKYQRLVSKKEDDYKYEDVEFEDVFSYLDLSGTFEIDFNEAEIIPYGEEIGQTAYVNNKYKLLVNKTNVFNVQGFRISYSVNTSGLNVHVSKEVNNLNTFLDLCINNVKPTFKWTYKENDLKNCFFDVKFNSTVELGVSDGKYGNYYLDLKNVDSSNIKSIFESSIKKASKEVDASIPICKIKVPIPEIPTATLNLDLLIKLYASGKAQLVLYNKHELGFETKDGNIRYIHDLDKKCDSNIQASAKAGLGANVSLHTAGFDLADVEVDGGLKAKVGTTIHLYDDDGNQNSYSSDSPYSIASSLSTQSDDLKVCGDLSFHWFMDLLINTSKTKMNKLGFSKTFTILDDDNQVFGNMHHIENGHFVDSCTRKKRNKIKTMDKVKSDKIVLDSYAEVLKINETYQIIIKDLPEGYTDNDLLYSSKNSEIASVYGMTITGHKPGAVQIEVKTKDNKYLSVVNILVSTG